MPANPVADALADITDHFAAERLARHAPRMLELLRGLMAKGARSYCVPADEFVCFHCEDFGVGPGAAPGHVTHAPGCPYAAARAFLAEVGAGR